jgi:ABC-type branched-subunit amino acid transport system ATPase component
MTKLNEIWKEIDNARLQFLRKALPLAGEDDEMIELARAIANAIGDISLDEALVGFNRALNEKKK